MLLVMVVIGATDILFALDSIPAIFGLTDSAFIVFTANAFSLMGLRQLYFLIDGLLERLVYLKYGLAIILAFIGAKLILHALHENNVPIINDGNPVSVIEVTTGQSLIVICVILVITVVASLMSQKGKILTVISSVRRHARQYLDMDYEADPALREQNYRQLMEEEQALLAIPEDYKHLLSDEQKLLDLLDDAHQMHDRYMADNPTRYPNGDPLAGKARLDTASYRQTNGEEGQ